MYNYQRSISTDEVADTALIVEGWDEMRDAIANLPNIYDLTAVGEDRTKLARLLAETGEAITALHLFGMAIEAQANVRDAATKWRYRIRESEMGAVRARRANLSPPSGEEAHRVV